MGIGRCYGALSIIRGQDITQENAKIDILTRRNGGKETGVLTLYQGGPMPLALDRCKGEEKQ
jgi:hypothetical protein